MWFPGKPMDGAAYGVAFKTGGGKTQTVTSNSQPWQAQQPYLTFGFDQARKIFDSGSPQYFPGQTLAGVDPAQTQALNATEQRAMQGNPLVPQAQGQLSDTIGGAYLGANPFLQSALNPAFDAVQNRVNSQFEGMGRYGSGAHANALSSSLANTAGQIAYQNYNDERARQLGAVSAAPGLAQADYTDLAALGQVGDARRQLEQAQINDDLQRYNYEQNLPNQRLANYMQMVQGNYGGSNTTTQPVQGGSLGAGLLGAGLLGAAVMPGLGSLGKGGASGMYAGGVATNPLTGLRVGGV